MQVEEKLTFDDYWNDVRFQYKKPILNGSLVQMYGDNFYHRDENDNWIQENSAHSLKDGSPNKTHLKRDTGGNFVLVSRNFYYFGENAIRIPEKFTSAICTNARNMAFAKPQETVDTFIVWLQSNYEKSILYGDPISWAVNIKKK